MSDEQQRHVFSIGPQHDVCARCGDRYPGTFGCVTGEIPALQEWLISAARSRGFEDGVAAVGMVLERARLKAREEGKEKIALRLWELSHDLPHAEGTPSGPEPGLLQRKE